MPRDATRNRYVGSVAITDLVDNTGGTADGTLAAVEGTYTQATIRNNQADMAAKINAILAALRVQGIISS